MMPGSGTKSASRHEEKLARRGSQPFLESAGLEAGAMAAGQIVNADAAPPMSLDGSPRDSPRVVSRVVEHLDLEEPGRVVDSRGRVDQSLGDVPLVVHRKLNGDSRKRRKPARRRRNPVARAVIEEHEQHSVRSVDREAEEDGVVTD